MVGNRTPSESELEPPCSRLPRAQTTQLRFSLLATALDVDVAKELAAWGATPRDSALFWQAFSASAHTSIEQYMRGYRP